MINTNCAYSHVANNGVVCLFGSFSSSTLSRPIIISLHPLLSLLLPLITASGFSVHTLSLSLRACPRLYPRLNIEINIAAFSHRLIPAVLMYIHNRNLWFLLSIQSVYKLPGSDGSTTSAEKFFHPFLISDFITVRQLLGLHPQENDATLFVVIVYDFYYMTRTLLGTI